MPSSSTPVPAISSLLIIGPETDSPSINEGYSYRDALAELDRLTDWSSATVKFTSGGTLHGTPAEVRSLLASIGGAQ